MDTYITINEAAAAVGLSAKTIRFYESSGVIKPLERAANSYRRFSAHDIERLRLVKRARDLDLPLNDITNIVSEYISKGCLEARDYIATKVPGYLESIKSKIAELEQLKAQLLYMQQHYAQSAHEWQHSTDACCQIIPIKKEKVS